MEFNTDQKKDIKKFVNKKTKVRNAVIFGNPGLGKSSALRECVLGLNSITITFSKDFYFPFECIRKAFSLSLDIKREEIISTLSTAYRSNHCIIYENFEYCDADSLELIKQVIRFHEYCKDKAVSFFEINSDNIPDYIEWMNPTTIPFTRFQDKEIELYIKQEIYADEPDKLEYACNQLINIADGNLLFLDLAKNILKQKAILVESGPKRLLKYTGGKIEDSLFYLYMELFKILDVHIQNALQIIAPFDNRVNTKLLKETFSNCRRIEFYLDEISKYKSFILKHQEVALNGIFPVQYTFPTEDAKNAVIDSAIDGYLYQITTELYQYLEKLYQQTKNNTSLNKNEYIYLLSLLTKLRNHNLTINHLPYYVELMRYYLECSSYGMVTMYAEQFLSFNILSIIQINMEQPQFFKIYFKALLALGQYNIIISYLDKFQDWELQLLVAYAYYNSGNPQRALGLCKEIEEQKKCGEIFSLEASIYDWLGDNKQSFFAFKKAVSFISNSDELKYSLYKKYSLYIDFELPQCKEYLKKALEYFKPISVRKYAETLHNYGTDSVITSCDNIQDLEKGLRDLKEAKALFHQICEKEVYYSLNSLAIGYCIQKEYNKAIDIWEKIDTQHIEVDFCRLAILNNLFCAYIKVDNIIMAKKKKEHLFRYLNFSGTEKEVSALVKKKPDIQHPIRQLLLNCGLLELKQNNLPEALRYFMLSFECSKYHSTMLYLIQEQITILQENNQNITILNKLYHKIKSKKLGSPGKLAKFYAYHNMYYCILMFWGDN